MKTFCCLLFCLLATASIAEEVDKITGFRNVRFGSPMDEFPFRDHTKDGGTETDVMLLKIRGDQLAERTFFGRLIEEIQFSYWENQLFNVKIVLEPSVSDERGPNKAERDALFTVKFDLLALYDHAKHDRTNIVDGSYYTRWLGEKTAITLSGIRSYKQAASGTLTTCSFSVDLTSLPILRAQEQKFLERQKSKAAARKDGF